VYDARSARTNVAAALAVWYPELGRRDLAGAMAPSVLSLVRAASSGHSATAAEILAEGMGATWQPLIRAPDPAPHRRRLPPLLRPCRAPGLTPAPAAPTLTTATTPHWRALLSSHSTGTPGVSPSNSVADPSASRGGPMPQQRGRDKGRGRGRGRGLPRGSPRPWAETDTLDSTPSFGNHQTASAPRAPPSPRQAPPRIPIPRRLCPPLTHQYVHGKQWGLPRGT